MSTRGAYGFRHNGIDKVTYNHCDCYPSGLGKSVTLFCEWAYIVNLDDNVLEIYKGFNKNKYAAGRYAKVVDEEPYDDWQGVKLFKSIPLNDIWLIQHMDIFLTKLFSEIDEMSEVA